MFTYDVKYKNFAGKETQRTLYFHLTELVMMRLFVQYPNGPQDIGNELTEISKSGDNEKLFSEFEKYIMLSYGERSEDGENFDKDEEIAKKFRSSAAYNAFFLDLIKDAGMAANFITGMFPEDSLTQEAKDEVSKEMLKAKMAQELGTKKEKSTAELAAEAVAEKTEGEAL